MLFRSPGMSGEEVLAQIQGSDHVPVIVLSAKDELDTKVGLLNLGANDYMTKPFESQPYGLTTGSAGGLDKPLQGIFRCRL